MPFYEMGRLGPACFMSHVAPPGFTAFPLLREIQMIACSILEQLASRQIYFPRPKEHDAIYIGLKLSEDDIFIG